MLGIVSIFERFIVFFAALRSPSPVTAGIIHGQEALDIICDSKLNGQLHFFQSSSVWECHEIALNTICSECSKTYVNEYVRLLSL